MKIKPMRYEEHRTLEVLYQDNYEGYNYFVISYGTHPCAYVELPKDHPAYGLTYSEIEEKYIINVHGGLTYSSSSLLLRDNTWIIGWDYAHCDDYSIFSEYCSFLHDLKKWTTEEIIEECKSVIKQLCFISELEFISGGNNE